MTPFKLIFMMAATAGMLVMFPAAADEAVSSVGPVYAVYHPESTQGAAVTQAQTYIYGRPRDSWRDRDWRDRDWRDRDWRDRGWRDRDRYGRYDRFLYATDRYGRQWRFDRYTREWTLIPDYAWRYRRPYRDFEPIYGRPITPKYHRDRDRGWRDRDWGYRDWHWGK